MTGFSKYSADRGAPRTAPSRVARWAARKLPYALLLAAIFAPIGAASADTFPSHPITLIVPFPAGGPSDAIGRIVAERMGTSLGQPVVVENVAGAGGALGTGRVAHASRDGYTLSFGSWSTHVVNGASRTLSYDVYKDFAPVARVVDSPMMIISNKTVPAKNLHELVAWLKMNPGKALDGTAGVGTAPHLAALSFENITGSHFQFVPYRGINPAMQDLIGGRIQLIFDLVADALPQVRAGTVRPYAVLSKARLDVAPNIPTVDEAGLPKLYVSSWQAIWAPKGTPKAVVAKLNSAVVDALADPAVRKRLHDLAQVIPPRKQQTPEALAAFHKAEIDKWWPIIKAANIKAK